MNCRLKGLGLNKLEDAYSLEDEVVYKELKLDIEKWHIARNSLSENQQELQDFKQILMDQSTSTKFKWISGGNY